MKLRIATVALLFIMSVCIIISIFIIQQQDIQIAQLKELQPQIIDETIQSVSGIKHTDKIYIFLVLKTVEGTDGSVSYSVVKPNTKAEDGLKLEDLSVILDEYK